MFTLWRRTLDVHRLVVVTDESQYRRAAHEADLLADAGNYAEAFRRAAAICAWLTQKQGRGSDEIRAAMAAHLELWTARRDEHRQAAATTQDRS